MFKLAQQTCVTSDLSKTPRVEIKRKKMAKMQQDTPMLKYILFSKQNSPAELCATLEWESRNRKKCMVDCVPVMPDILGSHGLLTEADVDTLCDHE